MPNSFWLPPECREGDFVIFPSEEKHHIQNVLRLKPGDKVRVLWKNFRLEVELQPGEVCRGLIVSSTLIPSPSLSLDLAQSLPKGRKIEDTIKLSSQIGLRKIIPFFSLRSVPRWEKGKTETKIERWKKIAIQESQVSGFSPLEVENPLSFKELMGYLPRYSLGLFLWENASFFLRDIVKDWESPGTVLLVVGPEGGFAPKEAEEAKRAGFQIVSLGERIFRTEIAGVIASIFLMSHWGGLGG